MLIDWLPDGPQAAQVVQVLVVQGDHMGEAAKVRLRHLPRLQPRNLDPMPPRRRLRPRVRRLARMPVPGPGGIDHQVETESLRLGAQGGLGERRATDVAEADEEDGGHNGLQPFCIISAISRFMSDPFLKYSSR